MRLFIKKYFSVLLVFAIIPDYLGAFFRYIRYSGVFLRDHDKVKMLGSIIATYHIIEKGLTMPDTRLGFGQGMLLQLINECDLFARRYGCEEEQFVHALKVIAEYQEFHQQQGFDLGSELISKINLCLSAHVSVEPSQQEIISQAEYFEYVHSDYEKFSNSRRSVRNYSEEEIPVEDLDSAIRLARNTPSSCNRQTTRVYIFEEKEQIARILQLQGGNRGFGHLANKVIVVVGEQRLCFGVHEKDLVYVDGGMFIMSLLYALHYKKIGACPLNCYFSKQIERKVRAECAIRDSEVILAMISCGKIPEEIKLASSPRKGLSFYREG